jgi:sulfate permease, SulP family
VVQVFHLPVETIETRFGEISGSFNAPQVPHLSFQQYKELLQPAFTIALLGAIESLLSAVVADGMIGKSHRSNIELVGQGVANVFSSIFGGIPATGAIARTATNIRNGGRTPVAGIIHAVTLLLIMLFAGKWAKLIPLSCLAGILMVVAYNMSEWRSFISVAKGPRQDVVVLLITFFLTVLIDLTIAIQIGMVLSAFLFMSRMSKIGGISALDGQIEEDTATGDPDATLKLQVPKGVKVYEINGPFFFGVANKFKDTIKDIDESPEVLVIRMRGVPIIDATGIHNFREMIKGISASGTKIVISAVRPEVYGELEKARIVFMVGKKNFAPNIYEALNRASEILKESA